MNGASPRTAPPDRCRPAAADAPTPALARAPGIRRRLGLGLGLGLGLAWLAGCAVGPDYRRPALDTPAAFRPAASGTNDLADPRSVADLDWAQVLPDPRLREYVAEALTNNWDLRVATARVLQAGAGVRLARAQFFPTVAAGADWTTARTSRNGPAGNPPDPQKEFTTVAGSMAGYELDLWGRLRRANESARARLLATEHARHTVRQTLVAQVASAYLGLLELDFELEIARRTRSVRTNSLALTIAREEGGIASLQDVHQSRTLVATAEAAIADTLRQVEQQENELGLLLGRNPGPLARGEGFASQHLDLAVPPGLPASLLGRRPDVQAAEQQLVAANADVGQARAAFFPRVQLTGFSGFQSVSLSDLFNGASGVWQFGPSVTVPVFTGGALRGNLQLARARFDEALAQYQKAVQAAFREVSDSLIAYQRTREFRARQEERTGAQRSAAQLAAVRYQGGVTSYLEVLYLEQELFSAELSLARARLAERLSVVSVYRSLGGGWQAAPPLARD